jgi:hypothetical protein
VEDVATGTPSERMQAMNTETKETGVQQYSSPLRISSEAVELRDITYPMSDVKAAKVMPVATNYGLWSNGIRFYDIVGAIEVVRLWADSRIWEVQVDAQRLALPAAATVAYLFVAYLLRWLYDKISKKWHSIYAAYLMTEYGWTFIAASYDKAYVEQIVATVTATLEEHRKKTPSAAQAESAAPTSGQGADLFSSGLLQTPVVYENYFRLDDINISAPDLSMPISNVLRASITKVYGGKNFVVEDVWWPVLFLLLTAAMRALFIVGSATVLAVVYVPVAAIIIFLVWNADIKKRPKKRAPTANYIYIGKLHMPGKSMHALVSIDYGLADKFVSSVNEAARKHKASPGRSTPATRSSPGST